MIQIEEIRVAQKNRLHVVFSDGARGEVDLSGTIGHGVFAALANASEFSRVSISNGGRSVSWPSGVDLCADALYLEAVGKFPAPISNSAFLVSSQPEVFLKDIDVQLALRKNGPIRTNSAEAA